MRRGNLLRGYLRSRLRPLILWGATVTLWALVSALYGLPGGPAFYTALLTCFLWMGAGVLDFCSYVQQVRQLEALLHQNPPQLEQLPPTQDLQRRLGRQVLAQTEKRRARQARESHAQAVETAQYYTVWSHQAKTPLAAMRLLLGDDALDRGQLLQELCKAEQYVDMALQYQLLQADTNDLTLRKCALLPLVKQAVRETAPLFLRKKIAIALGSLDAVVLTDSKWLLFVLEQLLANAVKYTPCGVVRVWSEGETLLIRDTGIGIHAEDLPRIFEWGYTGCNGREQTRATGIGLSLCKRAMDMLGHTSSIASEEGRGTTVMLDLSRQRFEIE